MSCSGSSQELVARGSLAVLVHTSEMEGTDERFLPSGGVYFPQVFHPPRLHFFPFYYIQRHTEWYRWIFRPQWLQAAPTDPMAVIHVVCVTGARWVRLIGKCSYIRRKHPKWEGLGKS